MTFNKHILVVVLTTIGCLTAAMGHGALRQQHISLQPDTVVAYRQPSIHTQDTGQNCVWNFAQLQSDTAATWITYYQQNTADTTRISKRQEQTNYHYNIHNDTLLLQGYDNALNSVIFQQAVPLLHSPFAYKDSMQTSFHGTGEYAHYMPFTIDGQLLTTCQAVGKMILPDIVVDTAYQVTTQIRYQETRHPRHSVAISLHRWYANEYKYPLVETRRTTTIHETDTTYFAQTYYIPQEPLLGTTIPDDSTTLLQDSCITELAFMPNPVQSALQISYRLTQPANVYYTLHYNGGAAMYTSATTQQTEGYHTEAIDMSAYPAGVYVLYLHVNDVIIAQNIIKT